MNNEIEIKILDIRENDIRKKLKSLGAKFLRQERQINQIFGNGANGLLVRLRTVKGMTTFTIKTPVNCSKFKIRRELECHISNPKTFAKQLEIMGFSRNYYLEKERTTYIYKGTKICIDEYPNIPPFLEIEGKKKDVIEIASKFGFRMDDTNTMDFKEIIDMYRPGERELRFQC